MIWATLAACALEALGEESPVDAEEGVATFRISIQQGQQQLLNPSRRAAEELWGSPGGKRLPGYRSQKPLK